MTALIQADDAAIERVVRRGVAQVTVEADLVRMLRTPKRPLRIKFGVDPSSPDLHIGHAVGFRKLRQFQELGHTVVIIIGDWTAQIGDPTGRSATRKMLTADEVKENAKTYTDQLFKVIDPNQTEIRMQTEWFGAFNLADVVKLAAKFTVAQLLARDDFNKRYSENRPIAIVEFLYPLLQGYDSVAIQSDVEVGGTDQTFNLLLARDMQLHHGQKPQQILTWPVLVGTDGLQKMSKSLGNSIQVTESPDDQFGKTMSLADEAIPNYLEYATDLSLDEIALLKDQLASGQVNPRDIKRQVAREIVKTYHGTAAAIAADEAFLRRFSRREMPEDIAEAAIDAALFGSPVKIADVAFEAGMAASKSEARRLVQGNAFSLNGEKLDMAEGIITIAPGDILQKSRTAFARLVPKQG